jgi:hypothetical protein
MKNFWCSKKIPLQPGKWWVDFKPALEDAAYQNASDMVMGCANILTMRDEGNESPIMKKFELKILFSIA